MAYPDSIEALRATARWPTSAFENLPPSTEDVSDRLNFLGVVISNLKKRNRLAVLREVVEILNNARGDRYEHSLESNYRRATSRHVDPSQRATNLVRKGFDIVLAWFPETDMETDAVPDASTGLSDHERQYEQERAANAAEQRRHRQDLLKLRDAVLNHNAFLPCEARRRRPGPRVRDWLALARTNLRKQGLTQDEVRYVLRGAGLTGSTRL